jgi:hypothetical protein
MIFYADLFAFKLPDQRISFVYVEMDHCCSVSYIKQSRHRFRAVRTTIFHTESGTRSEYM